MQLNLGLGRGDLALRAKRARGRLPRAIKRDLATVAEAEHLSQHPRIAPQIDRAAVTQAYARAASHLDGPEMAQMRSTRRLGALASLMVNLALVFVLVFGVLLWRDLL